MPSPAAVPIELSDGERDVLEGWRRRRTSAAALSLRARIVLAAAGGQNNTEIGRGLGVHRNTVALWRRRFVEFRLDGLVDEPRPGQPRKITDAKVEEVITKTLETTPRDATHWSTRAMAAEMGLFADGGLADLAGVRAGAPSPGDVEAVQGPAVCRQGPRRRRPVPQPARARGRAVRR